MANPNTAAPLQTGKGRATRIPLNYFKTPNGLEKGKLTLTLVALIGTGLWLAWGVFAQPGGGAMRCARGPVALVHASTETNCQACHVDFSPISQHNLLMKHPSASDAKCLACHAADDHHKDLKPETVASCAGCHRDHQGRDFSLVRLPDNDCISCHKDLKNCLEAGKTTPFANAVTTFATHPEFGSFTKGVKDPGKLKFNHKLHLMPGQVAAGSEGAYTLGKIKAVDEAAYTRFKNGQEDKADTASVQLDCASCHVTKSGGHGSSKAADRYMQPISYDTNCKACHPLTFDAAVKEKDGKPYALPHGKPLSDIEALIESTYTTAMRQRPNDFRGWQRPAGLRPLPGKPLPEADKAPAKLDGDLLERATTRAVSASRYLQGKAGCGECHHIEDQAIVPVQVPEVWFKHAKFSHAAHEAAAKCADCHAEATKSSANTDVLLPKVKDCQGCHAPVRTENGKPVGGVRHECTTCHTYHHGVEAGTAARGRDLGLAADWKRLMQGK